MEEGCTQLNLKKIVTDEVFQSYCKKYGSIKTRIEKTIDPLGEITIFTTPNGNGEYVSCIWNETSQKPICDHYFDSRILKRWLQNNKVSSESLCPKCSRINIINRLSTNSLE